MPLNVSKEGYNSEQKQSTHQGPGCRDSSVCYRKMKDLKPRSAGLSKRNDQTEESGLVSMVITLFRQESG